MAFSMSEVKATIRSIIMTSDQVMSVHQLERDFKSIIGRPLPYKDLGYSNTEQLLRNLPDVVTVNGSGPMASVTFVPNKKSEHIADLIKNQKSNNNNRVHRRGSKNRNQKNSQNTVRFIPEDCSDLKDDMVCNLMQKCSLNEDSYKNVERRNNQRTEGESIKKLYGSNTSTTSSEEAVPIKTITPELRRLESILSKSVDKRTLDDQLNNVNNEIKKPVSIGSISNGDNEATHNVSKLKGKMWYDRSLLQACEATEQDLKINTQCRRNVREALERSRMSIGCFNNQDAVPSKAVTPLIQRLNSVISKESDDTIKSNDLEIPACLLYIQLSVHNIFPINICHVHNPLVFFLHSKNEEHILNKLKLDMQCFYNELKPYELGVPDSFVKSGNVCAVKTENVWYRAKIITTPPFLNKFSKIKVNLIDYGDLRDVTLNNIKYLRAKYANVPIQVARGRLANIKINDRIRSADAAHFFKSLVQDRCLYAYVANIDVGSSCLELILLDTSVEPKRQINEILIDKGYAQREI